MMNQSVEMVCLLGLPMERHRAVAHRRLQLSTRYSLPLALLVTPSEHPPSLPLIVAARILLNVEQDVAVHGLNKNVHPASAIHCNSGIFLRAASDDIPPWYPAAACYA